MSGRILTLVAMIAALSACSGGPSDLADRPLDDAEPVAALVGDAAVDGDPYSITVTANPFGIVLSGSVPDAATRDSLVLAAYNAGYADGTVIDELDIDAGAGERPSITVTGALGQGEGDFHRSWLRAWPDGADAEISIDAPEHTGEPLVVLAVFGDDSVTLEGEVGSEAQRDQLLDVAHLRFGADNVDATRVAVSLSPDAGYRLVRAIGTVRTPNPADPLGWLDSWAADHGVTIWAGDLMVATVAQAEADLTRLLATEPITFEPGSAELTGPSRQTVVTTARLLADIGVAQVAVTGHTDNEGLAASNLELSQARADAVRDVLVAEGIDSTIITSVGRGSQDPIAGNDTEAGRARNRRIEITFQPTG